MTRRVTRGRLAQAALLIVFSLAGCGREERRPDVNPDVVRRPSSQLPQALMLRFSEVKGSGSAREGWELEVLQMGSDVRVRGAVRTGGATLPVFHVMEPEDYLELWTWLRELPIDRARLIENESAPTTDWKKSLHVDVVLDEQTRWKSRNSWRRPLRGAVWVDQVETRLHDMALTLADRELDRQARDALTPGGTTPADDVPPLPGEEPGGLLDGE